MVEVEAAVVKAKGEPFQIEHAQLDEPREDEVLVRIMGTGVCHTDLICRDQWYPVPLPAVFGHEGAGIVERVGARVRKVKPGDHVVLTFVSCGTCKACLQGAPAYCSTLYDLNFSGFRPDGSSGMHTSNGPVHGHFFGQSSFATHALAYERNVVKVPDEAPLELLGPLGCGIQTGAGAVLNSLHPKAGMSIAVFGVGSVGMSALMAARVAGCTTIIAVDLKPGRLRLARELGATHIVDPSASDSVEAIMDITRGGVDFSLETTASPKVFRAAVDCLAVRGICGLIGAAALGTEVALDMNTILFGRTVRGIIEGDSVPDIFIPQLVELFQQGRFPLDRLVTQYTLSQINEAAEASLSGAALKPVLRIA
jgi:aryl-alcohol dehydrogenase